MVFTFVDPTKKIHVYTNFFKELFAKFFTNLVPTTLFSGMSDDLWMVAATTLLLWNLLYTAVIQPLFMGADDEFYGADDEFYGADDEYFGADDEYFGAEEESIFESLSSSLGAIFTGKPKKSAKAKADAQSANANAAKATGKAAGKAAKVVSSNPFFIRYITNLIIWLPLALVIYHIASLEKSSTPWLTLSKLDTTLPSSYFNYRRNYIPYRHSSGYQPSYRRYD